MRNEERIKNLPPDLAKIYEDNTMIVDTNISIESVILSPENKEKVEAFIREAKGREKLARYHLTNINKILMYGASGTGKTYLTKALCNHLGYTMLYVDIDKSLQQGTIGTAIADVFRLANYLGNCFIFFDECDSLAWNRDAENGDGGDARRATNTIFKQLDQMNPSNVFVSATNMLHRIDNAFESRHEMKLEFRRPETDLDADIRHFVYPEFEIVDDVDPAVKQAVKQKAAQYSKLSYRELQKLVERGMKDAVLKGEVLVHTEFIYRLIAQSMRFKIRVGTSTDDEKIFSNSETYDPKLNPQARTYNKANNIN